MAAKEAFQWPWQYNFPPFFTIQPNLDTRAKQIDAWCSLVLNYYNHNKKYEMNVNEAISSPLFHNAKLNHAVGKLPVEGIKIILETLERRGNLEWIDKKKRDSCYIMWKTPEEWGTIIHKWAMDNGFSNTVCTLYEIHSGEDTADLVFHGIDMVMLKRAIHALQSKGKAELIQGTAPDDSDSGVKFFS